MRKNQRRSVLVCTIACIFLFPALLNGQGYRFRNYDASAGLPSTAIYSMIQDDRGFMWFGTGSGLVKFDGFVFHEIPFPDSDENRYITCSAKDSNGTLWFGSNDGSVYYISGGILVQVPVTNSSGIASIISGNDGLIWIIPQNKPVLSLDPEKPTLITEYTVDGDPLMSAACFSADGRLLIGTMENIMICEPAGGKLNANIMVEGFDYARILSITPKTGDNEFLVGTDGNGLFNLKLNGSNHVLTRQGKDPILGYSSVNSVLADQTGSLWVGTAESGVVRISQDSEGVIDETSGLPGNNVSCMYQDSGNNIWIGFNGQGLSLLGSDAFSFYLPGNGTFPENILYVNSFNDDFFLGTPSGYYLFDPLSNPEGTFKDLSGYTRGSEISSYFIDEENNIWFATRGSGLFRMDSRGRVSRIFVSGDSGENNILHVEVDRDNIWLASLNGLLLLDRNTGSLRSNYNINKGLPHNYINQITPAGDGSVYVACESERLYRVDPVAGIIAGDQVIAGNMLNKILAVMVDRDNDVWAATSGNGVFRISADTVISLSTAGGLMSNYCYSIFADSTGSIWIGHSKGFSVFDPESGLIRVYDTGFARGGDCNPDCFYESSDGRVFIGTTRGLIVYDRTRENRSNVPPFNNINSITINNVEYPYQSEIVLPYKKNYSVRISFVGINFSNPEKVFYSTMMENFDADWSELSTGREVSYNLRDGRYRFNLISVNDDGLTDVDPLTFDIVIRKPFWRSWWFVLSAIFALTGIFIFIVRQREKAQKKIQVYLEQELEARTKVVMKQKSEIELQNMEITDSINYARRIQSSILPDINRLRSYFNGAFITFYPRDIVSGDFYWFDEIDDGKFILVCADSTGHGVPGAFMSVIGSTLLRDIVSRQRISKPSEILTKLDKQIFSTLNQNHELGVSNDGMDVVVCEFSKNNRYVRFASAMRPVILVVDGEVLYIKGNRSSVGGESVNEKFFDDQEYYLNEGDTIYLFSDGLPDQFGGEDGKKMKIARLKELIEEISTLSMDEQGETVNRFYHEWKGDYDQVDDIIFMGVRV